MENDSVIYEVSLRVSPTGAVVYITIYTTIALTAVIGNSLAILSFLRYQQIRNVRQNYFLFGLALADLLMGAIAIPLGAITNRLLISNFTCQALTRSVLFTPAYILGAVSVFHVMALTADRYIAVTRAIRYSSIMTPCKAIGIIIFVWIVGILFGILPVLNLGGDPYQWVCELQRYEASTIEIFSITSSSLVPIFITIMFFVYIRIFFIVFKKKAPNTNSFKNTESTAQRRGRIRATVTSAIILLTHSICWFPISFKYIFESYFATDLISLLAIQAACEMLAYLNSALNPIIYGWRNPHFRNSYKKILKCFFTSQATSRGSTMSLDRTVSTTAISTVVEDNQV